MSIKDLIDLKADTPRCECGHTAVMHDRFGRGECEKCRECKEFTIDE